MTALLLLDSWPAKLAVILRKHALPRLRKSIRHPMWILAGFTAASLLLGERYPFSDFPMYSSNNPSTHYFYVVDQSGEPIPVSKVAMISTSKLKKIYRTNRDSLLESSGRKPSDLTETDHAGIAESVLALSLIHI